MYINLFLILLSRGSGVRIPPGSPLTKDSMFSRILFYVGGIDALRSLRHFVPRDLSCLRIPPGSPVLGILLDVESFLCGRDAIAKTFASPIAPKGLSLPLSLLDHH